MAQAALPDDILHLLCEELANQEQFDTLFNCACASRALAVPALTHLYKYLKPVWPSRSLPFADALEDPIILRQSEAAEKIYTAYQPPPSCLLSRSGPSCGGPLLHRALTLRFSHIAGTLGRLTSVILATFSKMTSSGQRSQSQSGLANTVWL